MLGTVLLLTCAHIILGPPPSPSSDKCMADVELVPEPTELIGASVSTNAYLLLPDCVCRSSVEGMGMNVS